MTMAMPALQSVIPSRGLQQKTIENFTVSNWPTGCEGIPNSLATCSLQDLSARMALQCRTSEAMKMATMEDHGAVTSLRKFMPVRQQARTFGDAYLWHPDDHSALASYAKFNARGEMEGPVLAWDTQGRLVLEKHWLRGYPHGRHEELEHYEAGWDCRVRGQWTMGFATGIWKRYRPDGEPLLYIPFVQDSHTNTRVVCEEVHYPTPQAIGRALENTTPGDYDIRLATFKVTRVCYDRAGRVVYIIECGIPGCLLGHEEDLLKMQLHGKILGFHPPGPDGEQGLLKDCAWWFANKAHGRRALYDRDGQLIGEDYSVHGTTTGDPPPASAQEPAEMFAPVNPQLERARASTYLRASFPRAPRWPQDE